MKTLFLVSLFLIILISISCKISSNVEEFEKNWADCRKYYD
jgi:hypothetical protein